MKCPYCKMEAIWCENKEIYGRNYGKSYMCYLCKKCDAYVGCHNNSKKPLGTMANKELREWRKKTHTTIDPIWRDGVISRGKLYRMMSDHFGFDVHIGESDVEICKKIIEWWCGHPPRDCG